MRNDSALQVAINKNRDVNVRELNFRSSKASMKKVRISEERRKKLQINEEKPEEAEMVHHEINSRNIKQMLPKTIGTDGSLRSSQNFPPQTITSSHMDMAQNSLMKRNHPRDY